MDWWNLLIWIVCGYGILSTVVAAIRWMTSVDYQLTESQKREASRHKVLNNNCHFYHFHIIFFCRKGTASCPKYHFQSITDLMLFKYVL